MKCNNLDDRNNNYKTHTKYTATTRHHHNFIRRSKDKRATNQPASLRIVFLLFSQALHPKIGLAFPCFESSSSSKKKCRKENMFLRAIKRTRYIKEKPHHYRHVAEEMPCGKFASQQQIQQQQQAMTLHRPSWPWSEDRRSRLLLGWNLNCHEIFKTASSTFCHQPTSTHWLLTKFVTRNYFIMLRAIHYVTWLPLLPLLDMFGW